jgi:phosphate acyltransferase
MLIAVDAAGGDYAPQEVVKGAIEAAQEYNIEVALVGQKTAVQMLQRRFPKKSRLPIFNATQVIGFNEHPVQAMRSKPDASIIVGTNLVRDGIADAFMSAGNTGAVLTAAYLNLKRLEGVERPALCGVIQIGNVEPFLLVDAGANVDCRPNYMMQFAQLGNIFAGKVLNLKEPRIALLNVGAEEVKGNSLVKDSYQLLKKSGLNFIGNMEGHEVLKAKADIIVTDGFTGNVLLKTMEGFGEFLHGILNPQQSSKDLAGLQGSALVKYADLIAAARHMDYAEYGGACLLGVNGNIIVAHGRSQSRAIKNAIYLSYQAARNNIIETIKDSFVNVKRSTI